MDLRGILKPPAQLRVYGPRGRNRVHYYHLTVELNSTVRNTGCNVKVRVGDGRVPRTPGGDSGLWKAPVHGNHSMSRGESRTARRTVCRIACRRLLSHIATAAFIQFRVTPEVKTLQRTLAHPERMSESAFLRQLVEAMLRIQSDLGRVATCASILAGCPRGLFANLCPRSPGIGRNPKAKIARP